MRWLSVLLLLSLARASLAAPDPEATNRSEHAGMHHLAMGLDGAIEGRTSALTVKPGSYEIPTGKALIVDSKCPIPFKRLVFQPGSFYIRDVSAGDVSIDCETIVGMHGNPLADPLSPDYMGATYLIAQASGTHTTTFLPRTGCVRTGDTVCRCHDPGDFGGGFVWSGPILIQGQAKTEYAEPTAINVVGNGSGAGSLTILSIATQGWKPGDTVEFAITHPGEPVEKAKIRTVSATAVVLDRPIISPHKLPHGSYAPVANVTRSVVFRAKSRLLSDRPHFMVMHAPPAKIYNVEFDGLGRTDAARFLTRVKLDQNGEFASGSYSNLVGRYAGPHFHDRTGGNDVPHECYGCTVHDSELGLLPRNGIVVHGSNVRAMRCVTIGAMGTAFYAENGMERGGWFGCLAINCPGVQPPQLPQGEGQDARGDNDEWGWNGYGFWGHGGGMMNEDCQAYGCNTAMIGGYGNALNEVGKLDRIYPTSWLREPLTHPSGKVPVAHIAYDVHNFKGAVTEDFLRLSYHSGGNRSRVMGFHVWHAKRLFTGNYNWCGGDVGPGYYQGQYGMQAKANIGTFWGISGVTFRGCDVGLDVLSCLSTIGSSGANNVFDGCIQDIKIKPAYPSEFTVNGVPYLPKTGAVEAIQKFNKRPDGTPAAVLAL